jgi:hypothetical protein
MSRCCASDDSERGGCDFYFPAGPWSNGCMYYREDLNGHCDNVNAQFAAIRPPAPD